MTSPISGRLEDPQFWQGFRSSPFGHISLRRPLFIQSGAQGKCGLEI